MLDVQYALHTHYLRCESCEEWVETLSDVELEMVDVITQERGRSNEPYVTEVVARMEALEKMDVKNDKIKKKKRVMEKEVEEVAHRMVEWEAEEASGDESVDSFE